MISAAIIVKNEEAVLERCIECVSKWADEIVIVDTGSTDRTKEIASAHSNVRLFDSAYFNKNTHFSDFSFSVAKNEAIDHCTGDWVVWWDADDFIRDEGAAVIRKIAEENQSKLYNFVISYGSLRFEHCRMFPRKSGTRFDEAHSCHEFLTGSLPQEKRNDVVIEHLPGKKGVPSATRNLAILEKDHFERKRSDPRTLFYLANSYREAGKLDEAVTFYDKYLGVSWWKEERFFAHYYKAQALAQQGKIAEARGASLDCLKEDYRFAEPYCLIGDLCIQDGDFERAEKWYNLALATPFPRDSRLFVNEVCYSSYPRGRAEECRRRMGAPIEVKAVEVPVKIEQGIKAKVREGNERVYLLPEDRFMAILAMFALAVCVEYKKKVAVAPRNDWQREMAEFYGLVALDSPDGAMEMALPERMTGRHAVSWLCRSAGFVFEKWGCVRFSSGGRSSDVVLADDNSGIWEKIAETLSIYGFQVIITKDDDSFLGVAKIMRDSRLFVGPPCWMQQVAASSGIDSLVFWGEDKLPEDYGWPTQTNVIGKFTVDGVVETVTRRFDYGDTGSLRPVGASERV